MSAEMPAPAKNPQTDEEKQKAEQQRILDLQLKFAREQLALELRDEFVRRHNPSKN